MSNASKNHSPRKVDLRVLGEDEEELALCEFKEGRERKKLQSQESKAIRLNVCLQRRLKTQYNLEADIVAINWGGLHGTVYRLVSYNKFTVVKKVTDVAIPDDVRLFDATLKQTLVAFFEWKEMLCRLNDTIFVAKNRQGTKRSEYEGMPSSMLSPKRVCDE